MVERNWPKAHELLQTTLDDAASGEARSLLLYNLALTLFALGNYEAAIQHFQDCIALYEREPLELRTAGCLLIPETDGDTLSLQEHWEPDILDAASAALGMVTSFDGSGHGEPLDRSPS